jgi:TrpR-related protein YerC/YecD
MARWDNKDTEALFRAILALRNVGEAKRFFRDLLSEQELLEFGKRWQVARMLARGVSYVEIQKATGLSSTTVARISKWLRKGKGGYRLVMKRMDA